MVEAMWDFLTSPWLTVAIAATVGLLAIGATLLNHFWGEGMVRRARRPKSILISGVHGVSITDCTFEASPEDEGNEMPRPSTAPSE